MLSRRQARQLMELAERSAGAGNTFFVSSVNGETGWGGLTPDYCFPSVAAALASLTAGQGDQVICLPGHLEPVLTAAGALTLSKSDVSIIGLGNRYRRAKFTFSTATAASLLMSGAGITLRGLQFDFTGIDALANPVNITGADCHVADCSFLLANSSAQDTLAILASAADRLVIENCRFVGSSNAGATAAISVVGGDSIEILNNRIIGAFSASVGGIQTATTDPTNILIAGNRIDNLTASSTKAITCTSGTTGEITDNRLMILSGTAPITAAAAFWAGSNYYAASAGAAGTLI